MSQSQEPEQHSQIPVQQLFTLPPEHLRMSCPSDYTLKVNPSKPIRRYQKELAEPGIKGENYIVCAPTGTGKTLVAGLIISHHLQKRQNLEKKVVFIVPTRPLAEQQAKELQNLIPGAKVESIIGNESGLRIKDILPHSDIIVCTADKLVDEIEESSVAFRSLELMVFDECHHACKNSPYAKMMERYLDEKKKSGVKSVPQVIGLTASPGAGENPNLEMQKTINHLISLCALMDATSGIKVVKQNVVELNRYTNKTIFTLKIHKCRDPGEDFIRLITDEMARLENLVHLKFPFKKWSQKYGSCVQKEKQLLEISVNPEHRNSIRTFDLLQRYSQALNVYMDLRKNDAISVLSEFAGLPADQQANDFEKQLKQSLATLIHKLTLIPPVQNPLLQQVEAILQDQFTKNPDSKGILFVRTQKHASSMCEWLLALSVGIGLQIQPRMITGHKREAGYGMTQTEQEEVIESFRKGECNVLVATSVAEEGLDVPACNLVIRFQHVSNEIAQTQAHGRARAAEGEGFTILSSDSKKPYQEMKSSELQSLVDKVLLDYFTADCNFQEQLLQKQQQILQKNEHIRSLKQQHQKTIARENILLRCKKCKTVACSGSDVFSTENSTHHVVPDKEFKARKIVTKPHHSPKRITHSMKITQKIHCICGADWGVMCIWPNEGYEFPVLKCKSFIFQIHGVPHNIKKWSAVPFEILPLSAYNDSESDQSLNKQQQKTNGGGDISLENQSHYEAYQQALKEGVAISLKYLKVLFFGPPRTGKTSMRRRLVGEIQNLAKEPIQMSTGTAEVYDVIVKLVEDKITTSTTIITKSVWSNIKALFGPKKRNNETDLDEELRLLYQMIYEFYTMERKSHVPDLVKDKEGSSIMLKTDTVPSPMPLESPKEVQINPNNSTLQEGSLVKLAEKELSAKEVDRIEKAFVAYSKVLHTPGQAELKALLDETILMNMVDTGGQPAFLEMLPALTVGPALYLIFFRLNQELDKVYQIHYVSEDSEDVHFGNSLYTVKEVIFQALSSIACSNSIAPKRANKSNLSYAAMLVGTHRDLLGSDPEREIKAKDGALQEHLREILKTDLFDENFLHYASDDQLMFAIDNMKGDEEELRKVRQRLEDVIKQEFDNFPIPASWLMFNIFLRRMGKRTLSLLQCHEIGDRLEVKDTDEALWFLHHCVGTLMHFPDVKEIKDVVICDPQVVFDSVTDLILNSFNLKKVSKSACDKFKETGQFSFKDIQKIAKNSKSGSLPLPQLVKLLEYLNIVARIKPECPSCSVKLSSSSVPPSAGLTMQSDTYQEEKLVYFMPAVLRHAKEEELYVKQSPTDPAPLMIRFKCGFVPVGVFCAKIASLVARKHTLRWNLQEPHKHPTKEGGHILCKNKVTFRVNGAYDVSLISKPKQYEIHIACISSTDVTLEKICHHVRNTVCDTLDQVISKMKYKPYLASSLSDQPLYELGFKCPKHPNDDHLAINRPKSGVEASSHSANLVWLNCLEGKSTMVCLEEERSIDFSESSLSQSFTQRSLVWFGKAMKSSERLADSILDDPNLSRLTISHLQLIRYGNHASNKQDLRLLQCLAIKWKRVGEILGLHGAVIQNIENPGSGKSPEDCIHQVFMKWFENASQLPNYSQYPLTWRGLYNLLLASEHGEAAIELEVALSSQFNTVVEAATTQPLQQANQPYSATITGVDTTEAPFVVVETSPKLIHPPELSKQSNSAACTFAKDSVPEQSVPPELEAMKHKGGDICPEFCESMSFADFIDLLKRRGVMEKDIELLTKESINAQVFVMVKKEELKELGMSFGGRKVLEKLMEEIRLQAMKHKGGDIYPKFCENMSFDEFIDLLKQRGVMEKDIELLTKESINAQVFVMVKKEELKELGISFGGRKVLEKLMEEIRLQ